MRAIPSKQDHFDLLELRGIEANLLESFEGGKAKALLGMSIANTLMQDGRVIAIVGFYELWPGVYELWALPSKYIYMYPTQYVRHMRYYVNCIFDNFGAHRLQTSSIADLVHDRWMACLGFECEGILRKYGPDMVDYKQWSLIKD